MPWQWQVRRQEFCCWFSYIAYTAESSECRRPETAIYSYVPLRTILLCLFRPQDNRASSQNNLWTWQLQPIQKCIEFRRQVLRPPSLKNSTNCSFFPLNLSGFQEASRRDSLAIFLLSMTHFSATTRTAGLRISRGPSSHVKRRETDERRRRGSLQGDRRHYEFTQRHKIIDKVQIALTKRKN